MFLTSYTLNSVSDCPLATRQPFARYIMAITNYI